MYKIHACMHAHTHACTHTHTLTHIHTHTPHPHMHVRMHTHKHTSDSGIGTAVKSLRVATLPTVLNRKPMKVFLQCPDLTTSVDQARRSFI